MIRCAMLRHAEMPKGSRRVPTVYDGFILGLPHGQAGRLHSTLHLDLEKTISRQFSSTITSVP
jgi:hypothetical protein